MFNRIKTMLPIAIKKKSVKNGIWMYLLQFFNMVVPLLTIPYITRILGAEKYGVFSIALNVITYLQVIVEYGFGMSATRKVALHGREGLSKTFSAVIVSRFILLVFCTLFAFIYCFLNRDNTDLCYSLWCLFICLFGYCFQMNWLFQGMQEMQYISVVNIVARLISVILIFAFVRNLSDIYKYCILYAISPFLSGIMGFIISKKRFEIHYQIVSILDVWKELKDGFYVFTTQLSSKVFGIVGITFLGIYASQYIVGIYSAIQKITNVMILCWMPISQVMYPITSKYMQISFTDGCQFVNKIRKIVLPLFAAISVLFAIFSKQIVTISFGEGYAQYSYWLIPLLIWVIVAISNNFWGIQILLGSGNDSIYGKCFQFGVVITILLNYVLVYFFKGTGAAVAPVLSEIILSVLLVWNIRKLKSREIRNRNTG